ncbi:MAG: lysylphosphatidylglycerol synthase transmembrane domain-containing protein [Candidatus Cloacimonadia bacterium]|jgi:uncharacterized protein (TIRG00374 family)
MKKKYLTIIISLIIGVLALLLWASFVDLNVVKQNFKSLRIEYILLASALYISAYFVRALRWKKLLGGVLTISVAQAFFVSMGGNLTNYLIPIRAGDLARSIFLKKSTGVRVFETLPSVFIDKLFDMLGIFVVVALILLLQIKLPPALNYLLILIAILFILSILFLIVSVRYKDGVLKFFRRLSFIIPRRYEDKVEEILEVFISGLDLFRERRGVLINSIFYTLLAIILDSLFFYSLFFAFRVPVNFLYVLLGYTLIYLSYAIPHPPAQIGSNELIMVLIFGVGFGMEVDSVSSIMLFSHILTGFLIIVIGLMSYSYAGMRLINIFSEGEELNE